MTHLLKADYTDVMETPDNRVNVPEIYLYGFGLKRKGGIRRPK